MFETLSCHHGLAELPDLTNKSVPQLRRLYKRAIKRNMPPLEVYADEWYAYLLETIASDLLPFQPNRQNSEWSSAGPSHFNECDNRALLSKPC